MGMGCCDRDPASGRKGQYFAAGRDSDCRLPLVDVRELRPTSLRWVHQDIPAQHSPFSEHTLMARGMTRCRQQLHAAHRRFPGHSPQLPGLSDRPDHVLVRRRPPRLLHLSRLYYVRRVPEPRHLGSQVPARVIQMDMREHDRVDVPRLNSRRRQQPRQPARGPQPLSRLTPSRPDPGINQHGPRVTSHQVAMEMQPPPTPGGHIPRHPLLSPLLMHPRPPRQRFLHSLRKHRHRITQHRDLHPHSLRSRRVGPLGIDEHRQDWFRSRC